MKIGAGPRRKSYRRMIGRQDPIGLRFRDVLPELVEQGFETLLERVMTSGEPFRGTEVAVRWDENGDGLLEEHFVDFVYQPVRDAATVGDLDDALVDPAAG